MAGVTPLTKTTSRLRQFFKRSSTFPIPKSKQSSASVILQSVPRKLTQEEVDSNEIKLPKPNVQEILEDPTSFKLIGDGGFTTLNIVASNEVSSRCALLDKKNKDDLPAWLDGKSSLQDGWKTWGMKLLICPPNDINSSWPLTVDKDTWDILVKEMGIRPQILNVLRDHNARCVRFFTGKNDEVEGFIVHDRFPGFSYISTFNYETRQSHGIIFGLNTEDIGNLVKNIHETQECLSCWPPLLVGICLVKRTAGWIDDGSTRCYRELCKIEKEINTFSDYFQEAVKTDEKWLRKLDTETVVRKLTIISTAIARNVHLSKALSKMLGIMETSYNDYLAHISEPSSKNKQLVTRLKEITSYIDVLSSECDFYDRRTEANRQTVYSLIAQKDNLINLDMSINTMVLSKRMANIAETNVRDSAAMVIISVVTVVFLPGTFVSSLFSTTVFDFSPPSGSTTNNHWHGIYWAITGPLTLLILSLSFLLWRIRENREKLIAKMNAEIFKEEEMEEDKFIKGSGGTEPSIETPSHLEKADSKKHRLPSSMSAYQQSLLPGP